MANYLIAFNLDDTNYKTATYKGVTVNRYVAICEYFKEFDFNYLTNTAWGFTSELSAVQIKDDLYQKGVFIKDRDIIHIIEVNPNNWAYDRHHWDIK